MKITENVYMLQITDEKGTVTPVLINDGRTLMLVDAGFPGQIGLFEEAVAKCGFSLSQLTHVIFTHQDMDHIGCINELKKASPHLITVAHVEEKPYIQGDLIPIKAAQRAKAAGDDEAQKAFAEEFMKGFENRRTAIHVPVNNGDMLPAAGGIQVVHTPGHTPGHICLYLPAHRLLITGDALNKNADGVLTGPKPEYTFDMPLALKSLEPLLELDISRVVCYHGGYLEGDFRSMLKNII